MQALEKHMFVSFPQMKLHIEKGRKNEKEKSSPKSHLLGISVFGRSGSNFQLVLDSISCQYDFRGLNYAHCKILGFQIVPAPEISRFHKLPYRQRYRLSDHLPTFASIKKQACARRDSTTFLQCGRAGTECKKL